MNLDKDNLIPFNRPPLHKIDVANKSIFIFEPSDENTDAHTVASFGEEWLKFNGFDKKELELIFNEYFDLCTQKVLPENALVLDLGCGSGRWSACLANRVAQIEAVDPSKAIYAAAQVTRHYHNIRLSQCSVSCLPFADNNFDFIFSLGVLHHIPDTQKAIIDCVKKLKPGAWLLIYLYYALDNRGFFYKLIFNISTLGRKLICKMPSKIKHLICDGIALFIYWPTVQAVRFFKFLNFKFYTRMPLAYYINKSFFVMRNDALDRFGTPLEQRFTKIQIIGMLTSAGLNNIQFSEKAPYWHCIAQKNE